KGWLLTFKKDIVDINSLRFTYSLRLAIAISFAMFLVNYFNIEYGSWMITSIFVVIQPYREDTLVKAKNRFKGTIIGAIFAILMFYILPSVILSMVFITFVLFMYYYASNYYKKVIWMSMLVIGMGVASGGIGIISFSRVIFVAVGILIALLFNKIFLPYGIENSVKRLRRIYIEKLIEIFNETKKLTYGKEDQREVLKLVLEGNLIEYNLIKNIEILNDKSQDASVYKISVILSDIRFLILEMYYSSNSDYVKDKNLSEKFRVKMLEKIEVELKKSL
ncbi:MAG: FUSC family protein, partial [Clostridium sp.]